MIAWSLRRRAGAPRAILEILIAVCDVTDEVTVTDASQIDCDRPHTQW